MAPKPDNIGPPNSNCHLQHLLIMNFFYLTVLACASTVVGQVSFSSGLNVNKCMNMFGNTAAPNVTVQIYDCVIQPNEQWVIDFTTPNIRTVANPAYCLDVREPNPAPGAHVVVNPCRDGFPSQRFVPTIFGNLIELLATGLCIGVPGDGTFNENPLQLELCNAQDKGQVWNQVLPRRKASV